MSGRLHHVQILAEDDAGVAAFYAALFGWDATEATVADAAAQRSGPYRWLDAGSAGVDVGVAAEGRRGGVVLGVEVDDLDATLADVERLGGRRISEPQDIRVTGAPGGETRMRIALAADPEGNLVGVSQRG